MPVEPWAMSGQQESSPETGTAIACFPLTEVSAAMRLAESHTVRGKVVMIP
jgi:hypothetical protein